jgi:hypothetical protein
MDENCVAVRAMKISLVPAVKLTALPLLELLWTVVLVNVAGVLNVPRPVSHSVPVCETMT